MWSTFRLVSYYFGICKLRVGEMGRSKYLQIKNIIKTILVNEKIISLSQFNYGMSMCSICILQMKIKTFLMTVSYIQIKYKIAFNNHIL